MFLNNIGFSLAQKEEKQKEKLKVAENKSPPTVISRINADVSSVPPSRSSETRSVSLASHLNPPQVGAFSLSLSFSLYIWPQVVQCQCPVLNSVIKIFESVGQ